MTNVGKVNLDTRYDGMKENQNGYRVEPVMTIAVGSGQARYDGARWLV